VSAVGALASRKANTAITRELRRLHPITAWLVIVAAINDLRHDHMPPVACATALCAAHSAVVHSRYRNLAIGACGPPHWS
jgi:hypothetical protein